MNILYLHGFGSCYSNKNPKVKELQQLLGDVKGFDIDYTINAESLISLAIEKSLKIKPDLIVGTSLGGWLASHVGSAIGVPFIACNPSINPVKTLLKHVGEKTDYTGNKYKLTEEIVKTFPCINKSGCGLILLDTDDDVLSSKETYKELHGVYSVRIFNGGSHRFEHMRNAIIEDIPIFLRKAETSYGCNDANI